MERTAAIPHDVALAAGDAGSVRIRTAEPQAQEHGDLRLSCGNASAAGNAGAVLRETCPEGAFPLAVLAAWGEQTAALRTGQQSEEIALWG